MSELGAALEAVLFASPRVLTAAELGRVLDAPEERVERELTALGAAYERRGAGVQLRQVGGGWRLMTRPEHAQVLARLGGLARRAALSRAALETLAVVAYRQPVTRAQIEELRGVGCEGALATLLERGMVEEVGRKEAPGRPVLYGTTREFLTAFGLRDLGELPEPAAEELLQERLELE